MSEDRKDYLLDVEKVLGPKLMKKLPRFAVNFFKRRIHQDEINDCIMHAEHYKGAGFFDEALNYVGITFKIRGEENLDPGKKYLFAGNHPLGGPEALIIGSVFKRIEKHLGRTSFSIHTGKCFILLPASRIICCHRIILNSLMFQKCQL